MAQNIRSFRDVPIGPFPSLWVPSHHRNALCTDGGSLFRRMVEAGRASVGAVSRWSGHGRTPIAGNSLSPLWPTGRRSMPR